MNELMNELTLNHLGLPHVSCIFTSSEGFVVSFFGAFLLMEESNFKLLLIGFATINSMDGRIDGLKKHM